MLAKALSLSIHGIEAHIIEVEVDIVKGLPGFTIVGLPDSTVKESKDRIRSAIQNSGFEFPPKNFIVNLAPAGFRKQGANFDLAIALAILRVTGQLEYDITSLPMIGELSLDGKIKPVAGVVSMSITLYRHNLDHIIIPYDNRHEAAAVEDIAAYPVHSIRDVIAVLEGKVEPYFSRSTVATANVGQPDFKDVYGQENVKRALEIAAAGSHNILLYGPPGSGKTMLARCLPSILPELTKEQAIATTMIHSVAGKLNQGDGLITVPTFRTPHHTSSESALVGGGRVPSVGEISLAHNGILFLDEFAEFRINVLQALRQPLEDHCITIARAGGTCTFPADFMLVASSNPCRCGYLFDPEIECSCSEAQVQHYFRKFAGPILDRIDIEVYVPRVAYEKLLKTHDVESSAEIKKRVINARQLQKNRLQISNILYNSRMCSAAVKQYCTLEPDVELFFKNALQKMHISARSFFRVLRVARTIADLSSSSCITKSHLVEALSYKNLQRTYVL